MELLTALFVLSLMAGLAFSSIGPFLGEARRASVEAAYWNEVAAARLALAEAAAGAVDVKDSFALSAGAARFRSYLPRLGATPIAVTVSVEQRGGDNVLVLTAGDQSSVLLTGSRRLRLRNLARRTEDPILIVDAEMGRAWTPIVTAPLYANAPLVCAFDMIARSCR